MTQNLKDIKQILAPGSKVCAVVKADAYGLGALQVSKRLVAHGVDMLAVFSYSQACDLVQAGVPATILLLAPVHHLDRNDVLYRAAVAGRVHLTVHSLEHLEKIEVIGRTFGYPIPVHVEVDTGMGRGGVNVEDFTQVLRAASEMKYATLTGIFSHPANADQDVAFTDEQFNLFQQLLKVNAKLIGSNIISHFANSYATLRDQRYHLSMVRIGLGLYGYPQTQMAAGRFVKNQPALKPIVRWASKLVHTTDVPTGTPVGYHSTFITERPSRLGMVPIGYADGYPLTLSNRSFVRVGEQGFPAMVCGAVSMDRMIIDLTDVPDAAIGTEVELIARFPGLPNSLDRLAKLADSSCYEMLARLSSRITRRYITTNAETGEVGHVATV